MMRRCVEQPVEDRAEPSPPAAVLVDCGEPFGDGLIPPGSAALLIGAEGSTAPLRAGDELPRRRGVEALVYDLGPMIVTFRVAGLRSADGFEAEATVDAPLGVIPERAELLALRRALLGRPGRLTAQDIARHFQPLAARAAAQAAGRAPIEDLCGPAGASSLSAAVADALQPDLFAAGLEWRGPARAVVHSPAWTEHLQEMRITESRRRQAARDVELREALDAARARHLTHLEALLAQLDSWRTRQPSLTLAELLRGFDPALRGDLYRGLLALSAARRALRTVFVVAGDSLWSCEPGAGSPPRRVEAWPDGAGPLRSVRLLANGSRSCLALGAADTVRLRDVQGGPWQTYRFARGPVPRRGVNSAAIVADRLFASHSERGLVSWPLEGGDARPELPDLIAGRSPVRDVQSDGEGGLWWGAGDLLIGWRPAEKSPPRVRRLTARIETVALGGDYVFAGLDDGRILRWDRRGPPDAQAVTVRAPTGEAARSLSYGDSAGLPRLLVGDGRPMLDLLVADDNYRIEFRAEEPLRYGWMTDDYVVGVPERRDRVLLWPMGDPQRPGGMMPIGRLSGHFIQDAALWAGVQG